MAVETWRSPSYRPELIVCAYVRMMVDGQSYLIVEVDDEARTLRELTATGSQRLSIPWHVRQAALEARAKNPAFVMWKGRTPAAVAKLTGTTERATDED